MPRAHAEFARCFCIPSYLRLSLLSPDPFWHRPQDAGIAGHLSADRSSSSSRLSVVVYSLLGACLSNETLSDMDMGTMSDEFNLFFGASFDGVRCCHCHIPPALHVSWPPLPSVCPSLCLSLLPSGGLIRGGPMLSGRVHVDPLVWARQLRRYRPNGRPNACRAAHGYRGSRRRRRSASSPVRCASHRSRRMNQA